MRFLSSRFIAILLVITALLLGCARSDPMSSERRAPMSVDGAAAIRSESLRLPSGFYPLALGNRWRSTRVWTAKFIGDGEPPWELPDSGGEDYEFEQVCIETWGSRSYVVERQHWYDAADGDSGTQHVRYRQDVSGLYEADICLCQPPDCSGSPGVFASPSSRAYERLWEKIAVRLPDASNRMAARKSWDAICAKLEAARSFSMSSPNEQGSGVSELTRLKYPLYPGQSWAIRNGGGGFVFKAAVEAFETIDLPVGRVPTYRVRIQPPGDPDDVLDVLQWWGECGYMRSMIYSESPLIGDDGKPIGLFIWNEVQEVTDINLVDVRPCTIAEE